MTADRQNLPSISDEETEQFRREFVAALADDTAHGSRVRCCIDLAAAFTDAGRVLHVGGWVLRHRAIEAIAIVTEMGAELAGGAVRLFDDEMWYAASALVRQLVEVEYIMWRFSTDKDVAARWLSSSSEDIRNEFRPARMRKLSAGRFRDREYWTHCELGGHPAPRGRMLLNERAAPLGSRRWSWVDLGQHLERLWSFFAAALVLHAPNLVPADISLRANQAIADWHAADPLAPRLDLIARDAAGT